MDSMSGYLPVAVTLVVATAVLAALLLFARLFGPRRPGRDGAGACACGAATPCAPMPAGTGEREFAPVTRFLLFQTAALFLYPVAVLFTTRPVLALAAVTLFLAVFAVGFAFDWRKGATG